MPPSALYLEFSPDHSAVRESLSAVVAIGDDLWLAADEEISLERVSRLDDSSYGDHRSFPLDSVLRLPASEEDDSEIDIEGMDYHDGHLWLVGSHSVKRKDVKKKKSDEENVERLATLERNGNRYILARVPITDGAIADDANGAQLRGDSESNELVDAIRGTSRDDADPHLAPFLPLRSGDGVLDIPGKDNGFDIEGLAVAGDRIFIGLRGPVLRGWAIVLEIEPGEDHGWLKLKEIDGRSYRKHFIDLHGLGIRDLIVDGDDLLILAGPSMDLDGPVRLYRWKGGSSPSKESLVKKPEMVMEIPYGVGADHAEGMALLDSDRLIVVYDSPDEETRLVGDHAVKADLFAI